MEHAKTPVFYPFYSFYSGTSSVSRAFHHLWKLWSWGRRKSIWAGFCPWESAKMQGFAVFLRFVCLTIFVSLLVCMGTSGSTEILLSSGLPAVWLGFPSRPGLPWLQPELVDLPGSPRSSLGNRTHFAVSWHYRLFFWVSAWCLFTVWTLINCFTVSNFTWN